jgi:NAD(P) transhydrogenase subunit alpha
VTVNPVIISTPAETPDEENRVALIPPVAEGLIGDGHEVVVETGAGEAAHWSDDQYEAVGCEVLADRESVFERGDVVFHVRGPGTGDREMYPYRDGQVAVGLFAPYEIAEETLSELAARNLSVFSLELMPRISRAQSMDALSSQASIAGYKAVLVAAAESPKVFPMEMTAAGTIQPAEVFVIGAGVAGLKAIATAERLGASTRAYDIRLEVKREVESLGADFVELDLETEDSGDEEGYAQEMDEEFYAEQRKQMQQVVPESDVVITTAAIPGAPAPELVSTEMIEQMDSGSVVVDLSAPTGGNCEPTVAGETVHHDGVTVFGPTNLPSRVSHTASQQYANNLRNFLDNLLTEGELEVDLADEIVDSTLLVHDGTVRNPHIEDDSDDDAHSDTNTDDSGTDEPGDRADTDPGEATDV